MGESRKKLVYRKEDLVTCPRCQGHKRLVDPRFSKQDPRCTLCHGYGQVLASQTCICGRPLRLDVQGQIKGSLYSCGRETCRKRLESGITISEADLDWERGGICGI